MGNARPVAAAGITKVQSGYPCLWAAAATLQRADFIVNAFNVNLERQVALGLGGGRRRVIWHSDTFLTAGWRICTLKGSRIMLKRQWQDQSVILREPAQYTQSRSSRSLEFISGPGPFKPGRFLRILSFEGTRLVRSPFRLPAPHSPPTPGKGRV